MIYEFNLHNNLSTSLQELSSHLATSDVSIQLVCDSFFERVASLENLKSYTTAISSIYSTYGYSSVGKLILINPENLSQNTIQKLLSKNDFVLMMSDQSFKNILNINEETALFILMHDHLRQRLNNIDSAKDSQTLPYSCAARSILIAMTKMGLIDAPSRTKELEIYLRICETYGQPANIKKIVDFLEEHKVLVKGVEINDVLKQTLGRMLITNLSTPFVGSNPLLASYSLFKQSVPHCLQIRSSFDNSFPENTFALMIVESILSSTGSHVIFCEKRLGKYHTIDPSGDIKNEYDSLKDLIKKEKSLGVLCFIKRFDLRLAQTNAQRKIY